MNNSILNPDLSEILAVNAGRKIHLPAASQR